MPQEPFFTILNNRATLNISGKDARSFLQGLITNDINLLDTQDCVYACLLTPQGKFLYDFFITENDGVLTLDCEGGDRLQSLAKLLNMYKLRAEASIKTTDKIPVYAIIGKNVGIKDPRHDDMGTRSFDMPDNIPEKPFKEWDKTRIERTIPDGSRDLIPQKSTMDEARMDQLGAVSYDKGCYVGQELTARMHYRGLGKKHLQTVNLSALPEGAELRSSCGDIGIALVKVNKK
jgi:folate-binding protein YgfZ